MTKDEMSDLIIEEVKGLTSYLTDPDDYTNALNDASRETGWSFPVTGDFKILWQKKRAKRHLYSYLRDESAIKFKAKQFSLGEKFEHFYKLVKAMDEDFIAIMESRPEQFAGVDAFHLFGTKIDAGFVSEAQTGRDLTYDTDHDVIFTPTDSD